MAIDKVAALKEYEREVGKPGTQWGSQEIAGFYSYIKWKEAAA